MCWKEQHLQLNTVNLNRSCKKEDEEIKTYHLHITNTKTSSLWLKKYSQMLNSHHMHSNAIISKLFDPPPLAVEKFLGTHPNIRIFIYNLYTCMTKVVILSSCAPMDYLMHLTLETTTLTNRRTKGSKTSICPRYLL